jgi:hypothetical protein
MHNKTIAQSSEAGAKHAPLFAGHPEPRLTPLVRKCQVLRRMNTKLTKLIQMQNLLKFGLATLVAAISLGNALPSQAETPDIFTKHGLPVPGAYFAHQDNVKPATIAVSKAGQGVGEHKQAPTKIKKNIPAKN